jgi:hypothetical protein
MIAVLLTYGVAVTNGSFTNAASSTNNALRIKSFPLFGAADNFVILAGSTVTNTGTTTITGDLGVSPGTSVVGFPPGIVNGTIHAGNATAAQAQIDSTSAFTDAAARSPFTTVTGDTLGGLNLAPGIYRGGTLSLTGNITLTGDANAVWIFQAASTLDTAAGSHVNLGGDARASNVYWTVGSSATLGANSVFKGNILAYASITLYNGAELDGRALAQTGAVTLNANNVTKPAP